MESTRPIQRQIVCCIRQTERQTFLSKSQVFRGNVAIEKDVDSFTHGGGKRNDAVDGRHPIQHTDKVREVIEDREIVFDANDVIFGGDEGADCFCGVETLFYIEVGRGFVEHVDIGFGNAGHGNGKTLEFTTRDLGYFTVQNFFEVENSNQFFHVATLIL